MSSRYEREIEEILRNTHVDEGRPSVSERIRALNRRPSPRQPRLRIVPGSELWLGIGLVLAFVAATLRWILQYSAGQTVEYVIGGLASLSFVIIVFTLVSGWLTAGRGPRATWRSGPAEGGRDPGRRPFSNLGIRWNLWKLRLRHRWGR